MSDSKGATNNEWSEVYDSMLEKTNKVIDGLDNADVDWFLRDSNVPSSKPSHASFSKEKKVPSSPKASPSSGSPLQTSSSPRLSVSNTNKNNANKTRPSVSSISEEDIHSSSVQDYSSKSNNTRLMRRRSSVSSTGSISSAESSSNNGGFFTKLKNRISRIDSASSASSQNYHQESSSPTPFKHNYSLAKIKSPQSPTDTSEMSSLVKKDTEEDLNFPSLEYGQEDPRLLEYIRYFRQSSKPSSCLKSIPSLQPEPHISRTMSLPDPPSQSSKISSLFRKMSVTSPHNPNSNAHHTIHETSYESTPSLDLPQSSSSCSSSNTSETVIPELKDVKPLKHVAFHSQTFLINPPQQIPSRAPRKGNVEVLPNGNIRINPLTEADKLAIEKSLRGQGGGLVVGGTGALGTISKDTPDVQTSTDDEHSDEDKKIENDNSEPDVKIDQHAKSLGIDKPLIHATPRRSYTAVVKKMALDTMYTRCCHLREILPIPAILKQIPPGSTAPLPVLQLRNPSPTMVEIQTFADFIRIAPIITVSLDGVSLTYEQFYILLSAMCAKKQLEKLSLRNTPINPQGWALLCWFLSRNKVINRLDITQCPPLSLNVLKKKKKKSSEEDNVPRMECNHENRSDMDWNLFTATIIARGGIEELILTGCCITDISAFESLIRRAVSIKTFKLGLAYNQLPYQQLDIVLNHWFNLQNSRGLDLGYNDLSSPKCLKTLSDWGKKHLSNDEISKSQIRFLSLNATNLRFNELFKDIYENVIVKLPHLRYLDMSNNPKLFGNFDVALPGLHVTTSKTQESTSGNDDSKSSKVQGVVSNESTPLLKETAGEVSSATSLKHSDSYADSIKDGNQDKTYTSEMITSYFCSQLLFFKSLARLHLDNNGLSSESLTALFETIPFCKSLCYLSIIGNHVDIYSATTLIQCLKNSKSLVNVDADYSELPEILQEQIGLYSMRNMDTFFEDQLDPVHATGNHKKASKSLTDELNNLLSRRGQEKLDLNSPEVSRVIERVQHYRQILRHALDDLFDMQYKRQLNVTGKETLIKLLYIDSTLERGLKLIDSSLVKDGNVTSSDIINMTLAEDEKSHLKTSTMTKLQASSDDGVQDTLSPVVPTLPVSRQQSYNNLASLDKEEGSTMKLSRLSDKDFLQKLDSSSFEEIKSKLDSNSIEEIKSKLLNGSISDLGSIIEKIYSHKGIDLKKIFINRSSEDDESEVLNGLRQELENFKRKLPGNKSDSSVSDGTTSSGSADAQKSATDESLPERKKSLSMNEAYDKILREFNK